jgi:DNA-binding response OmpR family regulator
LFVSSLSDTRAAGSEDYLLKPVEPAVVLARVATTLRRHSPTL